MTTERPPPSLPVDIYLEILKLLPVSKGDASTKTLISCLQANSCFRAAALSSLVWKSHYFARYTHCVEKNEKERRERTGGDWRLLYIERRKLDRKALLLADDIRLHREGRYQKARQFTQTFSFDVWDALRLESQIPVPPWFPGKSYLPKDTAHHPDALPRRYWAQTFLGLITRYECVGLWARIFSPQADSDPVPFTDALASLSSAYDFSIREISLTLDRLFESCLAELQASGTILVPNTPGYDLQSICVKIRAALHQFGFKLAGGRNFQRLLNQFPHAFLEPGHRDTIPMSLVYVFVAMARRLGIDASPVDFPGAVQAHITTDDPQVPSFILDLTSNIVPLPADSLLAALQAQADLDAESTRPASSDIMLLRAFNNMISFVRFERTLGSPMVSSSFESQGLAFYIVSICSILRTQEARAVPLAPDLDLIAILQDALAPALNPQPRSVLITYCEDSLQFNETRAKEVYLRTGTEVVHFVGTVFKHVRYQYLGCIFGWDPRCMAPDSWIEEMRVDDLPAGRLQPFYNSFATDGRSRYVAQENIEPVAPTPEIVQFLSVARSTFGRYFTGVDINETVKRGRLTLSQESQLAYPEDDAAGRLWVNGGLQK